MRLFLALELSQDVKTQLQKQQDYLKKALEPSWFRFANSQNLHLTLIFLGEIAETKLSGIKQSMAFACRKQTSFWLSTDQLGAFPSLHRPSVIWTGVSGELEPLKNLQHRLSQQLTNLYQKEKAYHPHLTLARVKSFGKNQQIAEILSEAPQFQAVSWQLSQVHLYESKLKAEGSQYQILHSERIN
ncbi:MAG: RNA 2',3'-cyclic phosphodiesterase [Trueperaceae bacterium]|nr:RNA 2',3'-cyclic phosphodiesterase [Trueperaceae bacterium]